MDSKPPLTVKEIRDRIVMNVGCTPPEAVGTLPAKVKGYVTQLEKILAGCPTCGGVTVSCANCSEADQVLIWAKMNIKKIEDEIQKGRLQA